MHADDVDALWRHFTSPRAEALVDRFRADPTGEALAVLDVSEVEGGPFVESGTRFFTVEIQLPRGRTHVHVKATSSDAAAGVAMDGHPRPSNAKFYREISREEFERLTRVPS